MATWRTLSILAGSAWLVAAALFVTLPLIPVRLLFLAADVVVGIGLLVHPVRGVFRASLGWTAWTIFAITPALSNSAIANNPVLFTDLAAIVLTASAWVAARNAGIVGREATG